VTWLLLFIVPIVVAGGFFIFGKKEVVWQEFLGHLAICAVVAGASCGIMYCSSTTDTETWNGSVTGKKQVKVSCEHDYCCQTCQSCSTDSKGNTSCTDYCCRTCYDHPYDWDWRVYTTLSDFNISRIDRQGNKEPPRWTKVQKNQPVAEVHRYTNYIKAAPDTLFRQQGLVEQYKGQLPQYPQSKYDYHYMSRLVLQGVNLPDRPNWDYELQMVNARVGAPRQANVVLVFTKGKSQEYFDALRQHWLGGKKNDILVVADVSEDTINWVKVSSWAKFDIFNVKLRDELKELGKLDRPKFLSIVEKNVFAHFERKPMKDFEYLKASITPSTTGLIISMIINLILSVGLGIFFLTNDVNEGGRRFNRYRRF